MNLRIPLITVAAFCLPAASHAATVVAKRGDTLSLIAAKELGSASRWPELCELNQSLANCDILPLGFEVLLPGEQEVENTEALSGVELDTVSGRTNLVRNPIDISSDYWSGYWLKPSSLGYVADPLGGTQAVRLEGVDAENFASGILHAESIQPGEYTIGAWVRSAAGELPVSVGISDEFKLPGTFNITEEWRYVSGVINVTKPTNRLFQIVERVKGNEAWEIFGLSVEAGSYSTPPAEFAVPN